MDANFYYSPEKYGLTVVAEEDYGAAYEFDIHVVYSKPDGTLWYASDAGCSCPTPFEYQGVSDLKPVASVEDVPEELRDKVREALAGVSLQEDNA